MFVWVLPDRKTEHEHVKQQWKHQSLTLKTHISWFLFVWVHRIFDIINWASILPVMEVRIILDINEFDVNLRNVFYTVTPLNMWRICNGACTTCYKYITFVTLLIALAILAGMDACIQIHIFYHISFLIKIAHAIGLNCHGMNV